MIRQCLFFLFGLFASVLCLLPVSSTAFAVEGSISTRELAQAVESRDAEHLRTLLEMAGAPQEELAQILGPVSGQESLPLSEVELISANKQLSILILHRDLGKDLWLYLTNTGASDATDGQSRIVGHDGFGSPSTMVQAPIAMSDGKIIFAVGSKQGSGTGVLLLGVTWLRWDKWGVDRILDYPTEGYVAGWGLPFDREFGSKTVFNGWKEDNYVIDVMFSAAYTDVENQKPLLAFEAPVRYVYDVAKAWFDVDASHSQMTEEQANGLFNDAADGFLEHNLQRLKALATQGAEAQKHWLGRLLSQCEDSPAKEELSRLLGY